ncbi:MAG: O-antigen ligase family protein [Verrucomicrobiota bacterium]
MSRTRLADGLFLAALFSVSFIGLRWRLPGFQPKLADFLMFGFVIAFVVDVVVRRIRPVAPVVTALILAAALATAYLAALPAIDGRAGLTQFAKGIAYFGLHAAFLAAGVQWLSQRSPRFLGIALGCLLAGIAVNGLYAGLQLLAAAAGWNLDAAVLSQLTDRPARSMTYGLMYGPDVPRARGLTRDPNHLGVMLLLPILALLALAPQLSRRRDRRAAAAGLACLLVVLALTLSRSAALGLLAGLVALALVPAGARRMIPFRSLAAPAAAAATCLAVVAALNAHTVEQVMEARLGLRGFAGRQHFHTYELIRPALSEHPLFGVGLNNFDLTYAERVLGIREASHSFYVQSLIETGFVGTALFAAFLVFAVHQLRVLRVCERQREAESVAFARGLAAMLTATVVANAFYMTMSFSYFYALLVFVVGAATVAHAGPTQATVRSRTVAQVVRARTRAVTTRS